MGGGRLLFWLLGLAFLSLLFSLGRLHPVAYLVMSVWLPLPVILVGWRLGNGPALCLAVAAAALILAQQPSLAGLADSLGPGELLLMGLVLNSLRHRGHSAAATIGLTVALLILAGVLVLAGQALFSGKGFLEVLRHKAGDTAATLNQVLKEAGVGAQGLTHLGLPQVDWQALILKVLPALLVINTTIVAWLNLVTARYLAFTLRWEEPDVPLSQWANPEWLIFLFLTAGFLLLVPVSAVRLVSLNVFMVTGLLYFYQGLAVIAALFQRFHLPWFLKLMGYALMFLNPLFILVLTLGLLDLWLDFRRLSQSLES